MSAVIQRAKKHYFISLIIEISLIILITLFCFIWQPDNVISFILGILSSFLPHSFFVYWFFFKNNQKTQTKITALYRGEGLKWALTILFIVGSFQLISELRPLGFFVGYMLGLVLNNLIPFLLSLRKW